MTTAQFDVFLSHNAKDKPLVERIALKLKENRLEPWFDKWYVTAKQPFPDELTDGLCASSSCAVFVGANGFGDWQREELAVAQNRAAKERTFRLFAVLLPGASDPFDFSSLPPLLATRNAVDLRKGVEDPRAFQNLINAIVGVALGPQTESEPRPDVCPYRGLQVFDEAQAEFFFGRDSDIQRLIERLKGTRFLAVVGASGSGKSSLVRAGLVPALKRNALDESQRWTYCLLRPGAHPLVELAAHLSPLYPQEAMGKLLDELSTDTRTLNLAVSRALADRSSDRVVWVIDQFEEVFTLCHEEYERTQFIANLLNAVDPNGRNLVLITLRADFYSKCAVYPILSTQIAAQQFYVGPLSTDGLRQAIEEPARRVGLEFEQGLVETILDAVENQPGTLPLLEHALLELWERRRSRRLTLEGYRDTGGVKGAIAKRADTIYNAFAPDRQAIARRVLLRLTQPGEGTQDTRRRATMSELATSADEREAVESVVRVLVDARLLTTGTDDQTNAQFVDVAHEALIRGWPLLRLWIDEDRAGLRIHRRLTEAAHEWQQLNRNEGVLYRGTQLAQALEWREKSQSVLSESESTFLDASTGLEEQERQEAEEHRQKELMDARRIAAMERRVASLFRWVTIVLVLGIIGSGIATAMAIQQQWVARSRELASSAITQLSVDPELSLKLATEATQLTQTAEAVDSLRRALVESRVVAVLRGHNHAVNGATFSPDGRWILTMGAGDDTTVRIWDVRTWQNVIVLRGHQKQIESAVFSPDGKLVVTASSDATARIWESNTGNEVAVLRGHTNGLNRALFSPNGKFVITASDDNTAIIWEASTWRNVATLRGHTDTVYDVDFSPDSKFIITGSKDKTAKVWEVSTGKVVADLPGHTGSVWIAKFNANGKFAVTVYGSVAQVWQVGTWQSVAILRGHVDVITQTAFSPDGNFIATASMDNTVRVWDVGTGQVVSVLRGHTGFVLDTHVAFSPDGKSIVTGSSDATVRVWEASTGKELAVLRGHESNVSSVEFSPDAKFIVTASLDATVRVWDTGAWQSIAELEGPPGIVHAAYSPDGRFIVAGGNDTTGRVWEVSTGKEVAALRGHTSTVTSAVFSPDGKLIVTASRDKTARVWDPTTGIGIATLKGHTDSVNHVAFSPDGKFIVTASDDKTARAWDTTSWRSLAELRGHRGSVNSAAFSPDGKLVITASGDGSARVWDTGTWHSLTELSADVGGVFGAVFSPDSKFAVTMNGDSTLRVWETNTWRSVAILRGHMDVIFSAAFSPDGRFLISGAQDTTVLLWDTTTWRSIGKLREYNESVHSVMFSPDGQFVVIGCQNEPVRIVACEVCKSVAQLLDLAHTRVTRALTCEERNTFLHENNNCWTSRFVTSPSPINPLPNPSPIPVPP